MRAEFQTRRICPSEKESHKRNATFLQRFLLRSSGKPQTAILRSSRFLFAGFTFSGRV
jgi:hypothetical protein